jgi:hypothetical protein
VERRPQVRWSRAAPPPPPRATRPTTCARRTPNHTLPPLSLPLWPLRVIAAPTTTSTRRRARRRGSSTPRSSRACAPRPRRPARPCAMGARRLRRRPPRTWPFGARRTGARARGRRRRRAVAVSLRRLRRAACPPTLILSPPSVPRPSLRAARTTSFTSRRRRLRGSSTPPKWRACAPRPRPPASRRCHERPPAGCYATLLSILRPSFPPWYSLYFLFLHYSLGGGYPPPMALLDRLPFFFLPRRTLLLSSLLAHPG